jgi:hypothetical protein
MFLEIKSSGGLHNTLDTISPMTAAESVLASNST